MTTPYKQNKKEPRYRTLVKLEQFFIIEHDGKTAHTACKRINEWMKRDSNPTGRASIPDNATPCGYYWTPVEETPYIVSGGEIPDDPTGETVHVWNGKMVTKVSIQAEAIKASACIRRKWPSSV